MSELQLHEITSENVIKLQLITTTILITPTLRHIQELLQVYFKIECQW